MRIPRGKLQAISEIVGIPARYISEYRATMRRPGRKRAKHLENKIGIPALLWLYGTETQLTEAILDLKIVVKIGRKKSVELCRESDQTISC